MLWGCSDGQLPVLLLMKTIRDLTYKELKELKKEIIAKIKEAEETIKDLKYKKSTVEAELFVKSIEKNKEDAEKFIQPKLES